MNDNDSLRGEVGLPYEGQGVESASSTAQSGGGRVADTEQSGGLRQDAQSTKFHLVGTGGVLGGSGHDEVVEDHAGEEVAVLNSDYSL